LFNSSFALKPKSFIFSGVLRALPASEPTFFATPMASLKSPSHGRVKIPQHEATEQVF
jgi:hypothetical protein